ncbi:unnamed protein product [Meganyctiphanes norvegica]|uniref:Alcohol dehydrogenase n=1 Tax=Meganyctiphanes norvegica TaxID=48144 RepID=A0AAV2RC84_MEGNR
MGKGDVECNATLFTGVGQPPVYQKLDRPQLKHEEDVIIKVIKTSVCGTDLHILQGNVFTCLPGTRIGHEGIGEIVERGSKVTKHEIGERVLCQCITNCGNCKNCAKEFYGHCVNAGWLIGNRIDGMQGEYARVPYANTSCYKIPMHVYNTPIEDGILLACDVIPTGLEVGLLDGRIKENMSLAIIGMGPVGIATLMCAEMYKPREVYFVDLNPFRLDIAESLKSLPGFANTKLVKIHNTLDDAAKQIMTLTKNAGVDLVVEAIGIPKGWEISQNVVRPGGHIALLGVHGKPGEINLERMWYKNFKMTAGLVHGYTTQMLIDKIVNRSLPAETLITHRMKLSQVEDAYKVFKSGINCLKIILVADDEWDNQKYNKITHWD